MKQSLSLDAHGVMTIGQMCEAFDVTPRTLRFYEQRNLIAPIREGQRRLFTARDRARLKLILRGKRFGFSLDDIQELLELYDPQDGQRRQLAATLERAVERLAAMQAQRLELDAAIDELKGQIGLVERMLADRGRAEAAE
ncbi:MerR family transcriptional regulator [Rubrimonas cliftonensis]|uniref:Transcriptional regulator, MerR family n=1 Tax=Rubrimonas cliftonensis TaxID=89524 RepID=A0A1H4AS40_9RHOB|nr:MerR family DNA-binding transcriptional regulator [Rubrimonas cliftonensis]SEA38564.1 transcriptional regulator, MerR family [Rubrimonas cliftonensis]